jgi:hypothetical protein
MIGVAYALLLFVLLIGSAWTGYATEIIDLNRLLIAYGNETGTARILLRDYTAAAIATTWAAKCHHRTRPRRRRPQPIHSWRTPRWAACDGGRRTTVCPGSARPNASAPGRKCVGKYFVAKGKAAPAGKDDASVVKEEQLPATLRVIKLSEGIAKQDSDPNRLTLVIGDDCRSVTAVWD